MNTFPQTVAEAKAAGINVVSKRSDAVTFRVNEKIIGWMYKTCFGEWHGYISTPESRFGRKSGTRREVANWVLDIVMNDFDDEGNEI